MDVHQLRVFASVYRNRSFSRASEELHLTQPTVSDHIKELEEEFNCRFFDRMGRTIIPTREAEGLYHHAVEIIEKTAALKEIVGNFRKEVSGEVIIGASTIPGTYVLPRLMADFKKKHPSISFQIIVADSKVIVQKVLQHELLLGIVGAKLDTRQIHYEPLMEDELILVSSPSSVKAPRIRLTDITALPFILREEGSGTRRQIEKILEENGIGLEGLTVAGIFGSPDAVKQALKAGLGVSILSKVSVRDELAQGTLKEIRIKGLDMKRNFFVATHKKRSLPLVYRIFLDHIRAWSSP